MRTASAARTRDDFGRLDSSNAWRIVGPSGTPEPYDPPIALWLLAAGAVRSVKRPGAEKRSLPRARELCMRRNVRRRRPLPRPPLQRVVGGRRRAPGALSRRQACAQTSLFDERFHTELEATARALPAPHARCRQRCSRGRQVHAGLSRRPRAHRRCACRLRRDRHSAVSVAVCVAAASPVEQPLTLDALPALPVNLYANLLPPARRETALQKDLDSRPGVCVVP
jgi:hypothetical protein